MSLENPGSLKEFAEGYHLELDLAVGSYSIKLAKYREDLADNLGVSLDQLHSHAVPSEESSIDRDQQLLF